MQPKDVHNMDKQERHVAFSIQLHFVHWSSMNLRRARNIAEEPQEIAVFLFVFGMLMLCLQNDVICSLRSRCGSGRRSVTSKPLRDLIFPLESREPQKAYYESRNAGLSRTLG